LSSLLVVLIFLLPVAPSATADADCVACHGDKGELKQESVHEGLACIDCHAGAGAKGHPDSGKMPHVQCASCHEDVDKDYRQSVHAELHAQGDAAAPDCASCHGPAHEILPASNPASRTAKRNLPETCGACHANPDFLAKHKVPFARPVETYRLSVHGRAVQKGDAKAASCSDCHGSHAIVPARSERSPIHHSNVATTCSKCHVEIGKAFAGSVHGEAAARGVRDAPVCTDCHGEHEILAPAEAGSLVNAARVSTVTCGRCHGDERLAQKFNLPADRVAAYKDSFHGLAQRSGSQTVANCASCHGIHNILPSRDPGSTVHPANLGKTCGACHPGAGQRFAIGRIHFGAGTASEHPVVRAIRILYLWLIPLTLGFMAIHNGLDFVAKLVRGAPGGRSGQRVPRMNRHFRIAHGLTVLSFPVLVVTGFALKYPESWWARPLVAWEGEAAFRGAVHRIAAVVLLLSLLYHVVHLAVSRRDRSILRQLMPALGDARALWGTFCYNLGLAKERPTFGRFSYGEKMEYLAYMWGSAVMAVTGCLLWFNNITLAYLPSWVADAATATHFYEAVLATLSILVWHFYMVIFDPAVYPMDLSWITGQASADHLRETRPEYYRELVRSLEPPASTPAAPTEAAPLAGPDTKGPPDE
jgi:formate dehydrogenase gamma subunit